jgi:hypothetical protein
MKIRGGFMAKFKAGDTAYIIESNMTVRKVTVSRCSGGMYLILFENGGGIQVKEHRLYASEEEALGAMPRKQGELPRRSRTPYDYI